MTNFPYLSQIHINYWNPTLARPPDRLLNRDLKQGRQRRQWNVPKKMNLRSFKLNRVYLDPLNMSNAGDISWSWILKPDFIQVQKEEGKFLVVCPRPPENVKLGGNLVPRAFPLKNGWFKGKGLGTRLIRRFHVVVVQWTSEKCIKKSDARAELLFWS